MNSRPPVHYQLVQPQAEAAVMRASGRHRGVRRA
ncbi:hypothetical protein FHS37_006742 [Streptomyces griseostramineus]|uniref:Uncharacterized protein n=1 Tax=Streptomyces griseomycini TaxID=66895 RepID=A0A7W7PWM4_9ACTN|nr:hypothetical protein [Streptomyces griseomycini]